MITNQEANIAKTTQLGLSLVIPLYNEALNLPALVEEIKNSEILKLGLQEVILVNNGSPDRTGELVDHFAGLYSWITPVQLPLNLNYGGGVYEGALRAKAEFVGYIPGDLQVSLSDVVKVWTKLREQHQRTGETHLFYKGYRTTRSDPPSSRMVSWVFTRIVNFILNLRVLDVNGLPKLFHRSLLGFLPDERMRTFVFDAQLLQVARQQNWQVREFPVSFHSRREGVSSWSGKRFATYRLSFKQILRLKKIARAAR